MEGLPKAVNAAPRITVKIPKMKLTPEVLVPGEVGQVVEFIGRRCWTGWPDLQRLRSVLLRFGSVEPFVGHDGDLDNIPGFHFRVFIGDEIMGDLLIAPKDRNLHGALQA